MKSLGWVFVLAVIFPASAAAHRLDEYLQATRIAIDREGVALEINLTPGAQVAESVFNGIDVDRDARISAPEAKAYADRVIRLLSLDIDGIAASPVLRDYQVPSLADMQQGVGVIRLRAFAKHTADAGRHQLRFSNSHRSDIGVYMVNALVPGDDGIHISRQSRDMLQKTFSMDYAVLPRQSTGMLLGLALAGTFFAIAKLSWRGALSLWEKVAEGRLRVP